MALSAETNQAILAPTHDRPPDPPLFHQESPFSNPDYGREGEVEGHVIASSPTWPLEESQRAVTGMAGLATVFLGAVVFALVRETPRLPDLISSSVSPAMRRVLAEMLHSLWQVRASALLVLVFSVMFLVEVLVCKVHRRHFDFSLPRPVDRNAWRRILARSIAVLAVMCLAAFLYSALYEYNFLAESWTDDSFYAHYRVFFFVFAPAVTILSVPYFWLVERFAKQEGPCDEFLVLANCGKRIFRGIFNSEYYQDARSAFLNLHLRNLFLGLLVKFFFIPLMYTWCVNGWSGWAAMSQDLILRFDSFDWQEPGDIAGNIHHLHTAALSFLITSEVSIALIGYLASLRLLDTQVTTAEPSIFGWVVALLCYPPFVKITNAYAYHGFPVGEVWHMQYCQHWPVLSIVAAIFGILLMAVYSWATYSFGLRFSNLTNRGIICCGPYRYVRHPAYICKNLAWCVALLPSLLMYPGLAPVLIFRQSIMMAIYGLRAWTEERHLMREPHYRDYCKKVPWRFIPGVW